MSSGAESWGDGKERNGEGERHRGVTQPMLAPLFL